MLRGQDFLRATFRLCGVAVCLASASAGPAFAQDTPVDFSGDGLTDLAVVRSQGGAYRWWMADNLTGAMSTAVWGITGDVPLGGDYDGDGRTDIAIWRPGTAPNAGVWVLRSSDGNAVFIPVGQTGDIPVVGDYDGDGKTDAGVYRNGFILGLGPSSWIYVRSSDGVTTAAFWGLGGDTPVPGDYDGDGRTDFATYRDLGNVRAYLIQQTTEGPVTLSFGRPGDVFAPGDYDGDGRDDLAIVQSDGGILTFWIRRGSDAAVVGQPWGVSTDKAVPGDYDGDGRTDIAVWRPSTGQYFLLRSSLGLAVRYWGQAGDMPVTIAKN